MKAKRKTIDLMGPPIVVSQADAHRWVKRQWFDDAVAAGWISPCCRKKGKGKDSIIYAFADVKDVALRIAAGEYPRKEAA